MPLPILHRASILSRWWVVVAFHCHVMLRVVVFVMSARTTISCFMFSIHLESKLMNVPSWELIIQVSFK